MSNTLDMGNTENFQGYFGKVPAHGDFIGKGLPKSFREPWDNWLQKVISKTKAELGSNWEQFYLTCPAYRFVLSPGTCGRQTWIGVFIPSVDKVGRYYPMVICRSLPDNPNPLLAISDYDEWFTEAEELVMYCLEDDFSIDTFDSQLTSLKQQKHHEEENDSTSLRHVVQAHPNNAWRTSSSMHHLGQVYPSLLNVLLQKYCLSFSVWLTAGSEAVPPSIIVSQGLPPSDGSSALLDGQWGQWGWQDNDTLDCFIT